ncbi:hypothetical protein ILUMI_06821 [Ignelater luminosus]|uniref:Uncharacterized protein n=1 Tax=Ignelater luminosus TaxID=2038154 RepID=A0A8K0GHE0_IGNLU|nr:hypothetical protein ILUMI_06821 [Ignelater luminosus]
MDMLQRVPLGKNRSPKNVPCHPKSKWKKSRGDNSKGLNKDAGIIRVYVRWVDNGIVTVARTCIEVDPVTSAERFSRLEKKNIALPCPFVNKQYNKNVKGTDQMDSNISW